MASNMSSNLKDQICQGEDLATAALKQVFGPTLDPNNAGPSTSNSNPSKNPPSPSLPPQTSTSTSTPFLASTFSHDHKHHLLLSCTGSVATIKLPLILQSLSAHSATLSIRIILTSPARHFLLGQAAEQPHADTLRSIPGVDGIYYDRDEWEPAWTRGAGILHIELRRWADALVVAPLSANTMAKVVGGVCDDLLTSVVRAWDTEGVVGGGFADGDGRGETGNGASGTTLGEKSTRGRKIILVAPAMNTAMWRHPLTAKQLGVLEEWEWVRVLMPVEKSLACGDVGTGAMKEWSEIVKDVEELFNLPSDAASKNK